MLSRVSRPITGFIVLTACKEFRSPGTKPETVGRQIFDGLINGTKDYWRWTLWATNGFGTGINEGAESKG